MLEITPEQREAAWQAIRKWTAAIGSGPQDPDYALDALIAEGWGPDTTRARAEADLAEHRDAMTVPERPERPTWEDEYHRPRIRYAGNAPTGWADEYRYAPYVRADVAEREAREAEARGYRAGVEAALAAAHAEITEEDGAGTADMMVAAAIRALADKPKEGSDAA